MSSFEYDVQNGKEKGNLPQKIDISIIKFFWEINPYGSSSINNIPKFLRKIKVLENFTENELRILLQHMHKRTFTNKEPIFMQGDLGIGFYFIYSGNVDLIVENSHTKDHKLALSLEEYHYFGELALLQESNIRSATAIAKTSCTLIGIFKPDLDELIINFPVVAAKLLQSVSLIIADRLHSITKEVKSLKYKLSKLEQSDDTGKN